MIVDLEKVGVVVIGRNEGRRLLACLRSVIGQAGRVVYVDSGSTDDSVETARKLGANIIALTEARPFTAARARNAGVDRLVDLSPDVEFVQFIDGDCQMVSGWLEAAAAQLNVDDSLAIVCGRRRERHREDTIYNRLCDMEWDTPVGEAASCGGDALVRMHAFRAASGFDGDLIAGEEPDLCARLRLLGWRIQRLDQDMTVHDADMTRIGQWWTRNTRAGHAFAEGFVRHGIASDHHAVRSALSILLWAVVLPAAALLAAWATQGLSVVGAIAAYLLLWTRVANGRVTRKDRPADAALYATFCVLGKFAEAVGIFRYAYSRVVGRRLVIIEYKDGPADAEVIETGGDRGPGNDGQRARAA